MSEDVETQALDDDNDEKETTADINCKQKRKNEPRKAIRFLKDYETTREDIELPLNERTCDCCGGEMCSFGTDITKEISYIPAQLKFIISYLPLE